MRLRVGAVVCLFLAFWGAGCRKALVPTTLDNQAPETWIVAAPQDTITTRDPSNQPVRPVIGRIPVRFHLYWAGADRDGEVVGYYFAVVETLPVPAEGAPSVPSLPGPKARDYQFTTKTDSMFIFHASEEVSERQHAFYIYAVDNKGRPDATPARFIFSSYDRFPPLAIIDELKAVGTVYNLLPGGGVIASTQTFFVRDSFEIKESHSVPRDTVPANALLHMRWHGEPTIPSTTITGYRYKLDEPSFNSVDSSVHEASYNTGVGLDKVNPGQKIFTLRALGQSGWRGEATRWFQMNFAPDTWFAGPDPNDPLAGWQTFADGNGKRYWYIDFTATGWPSPARPLQILPGTMLSGDSATVLPALRPERRTFMEIYNDRLWIKQERDTVNLNSWVVFPAGGFDRDSPYRVKVNVPLLPTPLVGLPVLTPSGPNGSPVAFRILIKVRQGTDPTGQVSQPSETTPYPVFDPASVFHQPVINGYWGLTTAGKAYALIVAEDGDGTVDRRIEQRPGNGPGVADRVDTGVGSAEDIALRSKIMTFYVDKAPTLRVKAPTFRPTVNQLFPSPTLNLVLPADDVDQLDPQAGFNPVGGTPTYPPILRRMVAVFGKVTGNPLRDTCFVDPRSFSFDQPIAIVVPDYIAAGTITIRIRLCDCSQCNDIPWPARCMPLAGGGTGVESSPGEGRCTDTDIIARYARPAPQSIQDGIGSTDATQRPGSSSDAGRRQR